METIATRVLIRLEQTLLFFSPTYRCYCFHEKGISLTASEEKSFENVDRRWNACIYYKHTYIYKHSVHVS